MRIVKVEVLWTSFSDLFFNFLINSQDIKKSHKKKSRWCVPETSFRSAAAGKIQKCEKVFIRRFSKHTSTEPFEIQKNERYQTTHTCFQTAQSEAHKFRNFKFLYFFTTFEARMHRHNYTKKTKNTYLNSVLLPLKQSFKIQIIKKYIKKKMKLETFLRAQSLFL